MTRVAIAGAGYFARYHHDAWRRLGVEIVAGVALDPSQVPEDVPAYRNAAVMLDEVRPDVLDIVTPPQTHAPFIALAAERGVDVICQKPFCGGIEAARTAVADAKVRGIRLLVHENFRFQPWYEAMAAWLGEGRLGQLYQVTLRLRPGDGQGPDAYTPRQPYFRDMERFLVHETLIHHIDVARMLAGEVSAVQADLRRLNPAIAGEDAGIVILSHGARVRSLLDGNRLADHPSDDGRRTMGEALVEGSAGSLLLDGSGAVRFRAHGSRRWDGVPFAWDDVNFGGDCVLRTCRAALAHLREGEPYANTGEGYLANMAVAEAVYRAHGEGARIAL